MVHYTALVPVPSATDSVKHTIAELEKAFERLLLPYEIICIDDASPAASPIPFDEWMNQHSQLRVLRFDRPRGISAALCAGIAAARGDLILGIGPETPHAAEQVPHLISRLSRYDFVSAKQESTIPQAMSDHLVKLPKLFAGNSYRGHEPLCFAAKRSAVAGLALARGAVRVLPELVARRGYRVGRMMVAEGLPPRGTELRSSLVQRLTARWYSQRFEPHLASELRRDGTVASPTTTNRADRAVARAASPPPVVPLNQHGKPA
jgi:dolichol-phosphate mannosyltransferase